MASSSTGNDPNWYLDSRATDHITGELEKLTMHDCYTSNDQIRAANGIGMDIIHIGKSYMFLTHISILSQFTILIWITILSSNYIYFSS
jgi:hypothetical protein